MKDSSKFNISVVPDKGLNYIINSVKRVTDLLKELKNKNKISEENYNKLGPVGSKSETLYGSAKVHQTKCGNIANELLNAAIDVERTFKCK